jgi:transposase, IS5 family
MLISPNAEKDQEQIRKAIGAQRRYVKRYLETIKQMQADGKLKSPIHPARLSAIEKLYEQQRRMYKSKTHSVPDRIVSLSQPFIRHIVRGKVRNAVEFGAKPYISVVDGFARLEVLSFDAYNEAAQLIPMLERYRQRTGHFTRKVLADKIYRNRTNLQYCKEQGTHLSCPKLCRRPADGVDQKRLNCNIDECARMEVERRFRLAKRKSGLGLIMTKLKDTIGHSIAMHAGNVIQAIVNANRIFTSSPFIRLSTSLS